MERLIKFYIAIIVLLFANNAFSYQKSDFYNTTQHIISKSCTEQQKNEPGVRHSTALILAFFTGFFGIHRLYLGYYKQGFIRLGLSALFVILLNFSKQNDLYGILALTLFFGLFIWAQIDLVRILLKKLKPVEGDYIDDVVRIEEPPEDEIIPIF